MAALNFSVFFPNFYCVLFTQQQQVGETKRPQGGEFPPGELSFWAAAAIKAFANEGGSLSSSFQVKTILASVFTSKN